MKLELGQPIFIIKNLKIISGRLCGYRAEFFAPWSEWANKFQVNWMEDKHNLLEICVNFKSVTAGDGTNEWFNQKLIFTEEKKALEKLTALKKEHKDNLETIIKEAKQKLNNFYALPTQD